MIPVGDWIGEITATVGTGSIGLGGQIEGNAPFSILPDGEVYYTIVDGDNRESGIGTKSGVNLERTTITATIYEGVYSETGDPIALSGLAEVYCAFSARAYADLYSAIDNIQPSAAVSTSIIGPATVTNGSTTEYQITNYSSFSEYTASVTGGSATIVDDVITLTADDIVGEPLISMVISRDGEETSFSIDTIDATSITPNTWDVLAPKYLGSGGSSTGHSRIIHLYDEVFWAVFEGGYASITINGGVNWNPITVKAGLSIGETSSYIPLYRKSVGKMYAIPTAEDFVGFTESSDLGVTWAYSSDYDRNGGVTPTCNAAIDELLGHIYVLANTSASIEVNELGGNRFIARDTSGDNNGVSITGSIDSSVAISTGLNGLASRSTDGFNTFSDYTAGLGVTGLSSIIPCMFSAGNGVWISVQDGGPVLYSLDDGLNFSAGTSGTNVVVGNAGSDSHAAIACFDTKAIILHTDGSMSYTDDFTEFDSWQTANVNDAIGATTYLQSFIATSGMNWLAISSDSEVYKASEA